MTRAKLAWGAGALGMGLLALVWWLPPPSSGSAPDRPAPGDAPEARDLSWPVAPVGDGMAQLLTETSAPDPEADERPAQAKGRLDGLIERLQEIEAKAPLGFHEQAAAELEVFVQEDIEPSLPTAVLAALDSQEFSPYVRGALCALAGGLSGPVLVLERSGTTGEVWRSTLVGLAWDVLEEGGGLALETGPFLEMEPRGGTTLLGLTLSRPPDEGLAGLLEARVLEPAETRDDLLTRDTLVFALGTGVDQRPRTLELFTRMLFDPSPQMLQARAAICYVLARARSDEARATLLAFLEDEQAGNIGKLMARWWMSETRLIPGELGALVAPLENQDPAPLAHIDRMGAIGAVMKRLDSATPDELGQIEELLALHARELEHGTERLAAIRALAMAPGGFTRMSALERALSTDTKVHCRISAAKGLGSTGPPLQSEALGLLHTAFQTETDPEVQQAIQEAQAELETALEGGDG